MTSLSQFNIRITALANRFDENRIKTVKKVALAVDQAVVLATPVDTGRARANWLVNVGAERTTAIEPYAEGTGGSTGAVNAQAAIDQAKAAVATYAGHYGEAIYMTNNLPYIEALNEGHSAQAPAGYIETAVTAAVRALINNRLLPP